MIKKRIELINYDKFASTYIIDIPNLRNKVFSH